MSITDRNFSHCSTYAESVAQFCAYVSVLHLSGNTILTSQLKAMFSRCRALQEVQLHYIMISDVAPDDQASCAAGNVTHLILNKLACETSLSRVLACCPALTHLEFQSCKGASLQYDQLVLFAQLCPHLRTLIVESTGWAAGALMAVSQLHELEHLVLDRGVTDEILAAISHGCPRLQELRIAHYSYSDGLRAVTDQSIVALSQHCSQLHTLSLQHCRLLTDRALSALVVGCPLLKIVCLESCGYITGAGLVALHQGCRHLQKISVSSCMTRYMTWQQRDVLYPVLDVIGGRYQKPEEDRDYDYDIDAWNDRQRRRERELLGIR